MKEQEDFYQEVPKEQRAEMLQNIAVKSEYQKVKRPYSEHEKLRLKDEVVNESTIIMEQKDEMAKIVKEFKTAIKAATSAVKDSLLNIKRGYSENEELVFLVDDQEGGKMHTVDADGVILSTRPLFPNERQTTILTMPKTGTNN